MCMYKYADKCSFRTERENKEHGKVDCIKVLKHMDNFQLNDGGYNM
jgi:hypothetical protein